MKKTILTTLSLGTLILGGTVIDGQIDPYTDTGTKYEIVVAGDAINIDKITNEVELTKWSGEESIKVKAVGDYEPSSKNLFSTIREATSVDGKTATIIEPTEEGINIDTVLYEKPATNIFSYEITGWKNFDFFYQPPLNEEVQADGDVCTPTECTNENSLRADKITTKRSLDVVGSYAVYHKSKKDNQYQVGKAFHIFRPKIIANDGQETWGELLFKNGILSVTVPQDFLDKAEYPVKVDPTFGYTTGGATSSYHGQNNLDGSVYTSGSDAGGSAVDSISVYGNCGDSGCPTFAVKTVITNSSWIILTDGVSAGVTPTWNNDAGAATWYTWTYSSKPSLSASTDYFLAIVNINNYKKLWYDSSGSHKLDTSNSYATPTNPTDGSTGTRKYSFYVTYTVSGGGGGSATTTDENNFILFN